MKKNQSGIKKRIAQIQAFLKETPEEPFLQYALAQELLKAGETDEALQNFEQLLEQHPDYAGAYYHLGKLYEATGEPERAAKIYSKGMEVARNVGEVHTREELKEAFRLLKG